TYDPETRNGSSPDGRKVKGTIHWLSSEYAKPVSLRLYDRLFTLEDLGDMEEGTDFGDYLNENSLTVLDNAYVEPSLADSKAGDRFQFVRNGYFCRDSKYDNTFNLIVGLKDSYTPKEK
ncbi:MAG: glutamine--tRNA ligase, partial [Clostridia bacterium]|nr:glutamine--tRNA ligase [Clostridia bacterium]